MSEEWDFYFCQVDEKPASIFVDLGLHGDVPVAALPNRAYLSVVMRHPRDDGLSSQEEYKALEALEDGVRAHLANAETVYVGRNTCDGRRDFWFYIADAANWDRVASDFMAAFPDYAFDTAAESDPDWAAYLEFLYPNEQGWDFITNRRVCDRLEAGGDPLTQERDVDHWAYFPDAASRDAFVASAQAMGFHVRDLLPPGEEDSDHGVQLFRRDVPSHRGIHDITVPLLRSAREAGGRYDGWETEQLSAG